MIVWQFQQMNQAHPRVAHGAYDYFYISDFVFDAELAAGAAAVGCNTNEWSQY